MKGTSNFKGSTGDHASAHDHLRKSGAAAFTGHKEMWIQNHVVRGIRVSEDVVRKTAAQTQRTFWETCGQPTVAVLPTVTAINVLQRIVQSMSASQSTFALAERDAPHDHQTAMEDRTLLAQHARCALWSARVQVFLASWEAYVLCRQDGPANTVRDI